METLAGRAHPTFCVVDHKNLSFLQNVKWPNSWHSFFIASGSLTCTAQVPTTPNRILCHISSPPIPAVQNPSPFCLPPALGAATWQVEGRVLEAQLTTPDPGGGLPNFLFVPDSAIDWIINPSAVHLKFPLLLNVHPTFHISWASEVDLVPLSELPHPPHFIECDPA